MPWPFFRRDKFFPAKTKRRGNDFRGFFGAAKINFRRLRKIFLLRGNDVFPREKFALFWKNFEEIRECFRAARRIFYRNPRLAVPEKIESSKNRKTHRNSVVVVSFNLEISAKLLGAGTKCRKRNRENFQRVFALKNVFFAKNFRKLRRHRKNSVSFLLSRVRNSKNFQRISRYREFRLKTMKKNRQRGILNSTLNSRLF